MVTTARLPSLPLATLAAEQLRAPRVALADLLDELPPWLRASVKGSLLDHAAGPWLDLLRAELYSAGASRDT